MAKPTYARILQFIIDNGRVAINSDGSFQTESLEEEMVYQANHCGMSDEEIEEAKWFALTHCDNKPGDQDN